MQVESQGQEDALEEGMTIHSSILAWRILWTEEPVGYKGVDMTEVTQHACDVGFLVVTHVLWDSKMLTTGELWWGTSVNSVLSLQLFCTF